MAHLHLILVLAAFVLFVLSACGAPSGKVKLQSAGLACWIATLFL